VFNYSGVINYLKRRFPFLNQLTNFYEFICENNPMLLDYYDHTNEDNDDTNEPVVEQPKKVLVKFEDKYLARFKAFPNEFRIDETEFKQENEEYEKIKLDYEKTRLDTINAIQERLFKINQIQEEGDISHKNERYTENINAFGINCLIKFFDIEEEYNRDQDDFDIEEIYQHLLKDKE
jgi:hypothetical protein